MLRTATVIILCAAAAVACGSRATNSGTSPSPVPTSPTAWADEFDGPANAAPDAAKWTYDLGGGGWGNQELETYTNAPDNVHLDGDGHLIVRAIANGTAFTSARLKTQGRFTAQYGRLEARIKLPTGRGIWPAFWMLGSSITTAGWPQCGEIDVMENIGSEPSVNHGSVHGPGYSGGRAITARYTLPGGGRFADAFHTFAIDWTPDRIVFSVDDAPYQTVTRASLPAGTAWVFDAPFFLLLNVAVGGTFPGPPDATTVFPQEMVVDYVRYRPAQAQAWIDNLTGIPQVWATRMVVR
jgi:beta-glucanase (GH16 family)